MAADQTTTPSERPVCVITGAASGIGAATALEFARTVQARIVAADLQHDRLDAVCRSVVEAGGEAVAVAADVRSPDDCERVARAALEAFGRIDVMHVNAGMVDQSTIDGGDPARWRAVVETNVLGAAFSVRAVLPAMLEQQHGHVIFTASVSGRETYVGEPLYIASKWGLVGFGHALRKEVAERGIRVTLIEPGLVDTPFTRGSPVIAPLFEGAAPLLPEDIARAVVYAYLQPDYVNVSEIVLEPVRQRELTPEELERGLAALAVERGEPPSRLDPTRHPQ
jgi:NADP-dependent 3-hydroxy acid dehydrogenase YdfG